MNLTHEELISQYDNARWRAWKLGTAPSVLEGLALDKNPDVRLGVAWNPSAWYKTLLTLKVDDDARVRAAAEESLRVKVAD